MKRIIFLTILLVIMYSELMAQFNIGVQGGASASFTSFKFKDYLNGVENRRLYSKSHWFADYCSNWWINGECLSLIKDFHCNRKLLFENKEPGLWCHQYFIHFPEMIRYNIPVKPKSNKSFFIEAGPYFSYDFSKRYVHMKIMWWVIIFLLALPLWVIMPQESQTTYLSKNRCWYGNRNWL